MARPVRTKNKDNARRSKKRISILTQEKVTYVDYKEVNLLPRFQSDRAKIRARRVTGNSSQQQAEVAMAIKNMIANLTGMICDGAKPSCALKLASGVSTAVLSAMLAMEHRCVSSLEGIIDEDVDRSIRNLTTIGREGMNETDSLILGIMTDKC